MPTVMPEKYIKIMKIKTPKYKKRKGLLCLSKNSENLSATGTDALDGLHAILHNDFFRVLNSYLLFALHTSSFCHKNHP